MKLKKAKITILIGQDKTTIELIDASSSMIFAEVTLTPEQLSSALSRCSYTPCEIIVSDWLDRLDKEMSVAKHEFAIPKDLSRTDKDKLIELASATCPDGWEPDSYFGSQDSFFQKDGTKYCRVTIRKWD